jgi:hypothetical protein
MKLLLQINQVEKIQNLNQEILFSFYYIEILGVLISHDRTLVQRAYRAAVIAARLGKSFY